MKALLRGFCLVAVVVSLWGLPGCGTDNDSTASRQQTNLGAAPTTDVKGATDAPPPPRDMAEYAAQKKDPFAGTKYGGAPKKK